MRMRRLSTRFDADEEAEFRAFFQAEFSSFVHLASTFAVPLSIIFVDHAYALFCVAWSLAFFGVCQLSASLRAHQFEYLPILSASIHVATGKVHLFAQSQVCAVFTVFVLHLHVLDVRKSLAILAVCGASALHIAPHMAVDVTLAVFYGSVIGIMTEYLVRLSFIYSKQTAELHTYMALQVAYADANHYAKSACLIVLRHLQASPPAVASAARALHRLTQKMHMVEVLRLVELGRYVSHKARVDVSELVDTDVEVIAACAPGERLRPDLPRASTAHPLARCH